MSSLYDWHGAVSVLSVTDGRPRMFAVFGLHTEVYTIRRLAEALFGWLP